MKYKRSILAAYDRKIYLCGMCHIKTIFPDMGSPMIKKRWSYDHLFFIMEIPCLYHGGSHAHYISNLSSMIPASNTFLAATKQLYVVRPSVCLSVHHTFFTMFPSLYHHEIFRSYYHGQKCCPCKRSRSKVKGQGHKGQHPTSPFPDSNSSLNWHMAMKSCTQLEAA